MNLHVDSAQVLLDRLLYAFEQHTGGRDTRRICFVVGAPLSSPSVPGVRMMVQRIQRSLGLSTGEFETGLARYEGGNEYQRAFAMLYGRRGPESANQLIQEAVLDAYQGERPNVLSRAACRSLENDHQHWTIPPGCEALAEIISIFEARFAPVVLTTNFDPLLEVALRRHGVKPGISVLDRDGRLGTARYDGVHVVHVHGYWDGADTLHTPQQLSQQRPYLHDSLQALIEDMTVVVFAYGGWDDALTRAIASVGSNLERRPDVIWTLRGEDKGQVEKETESLRSKVGDIASTPRLMFYTGVDVHDFLPRLRRLLVDRRHEPDLRIGAPAQLPSSVDAYWDVVKAEFALITERRRNPVPESKTCRLLFGDTLAAGATVLPELSRCAVVFDVEEFLAARACRPIPGSDREQGFRPVTISKAASARWRVLVSLIAAGLETPDRATILDPFIKGLLAGPLQQDPSDQLDRLARQYARANTDAGLFETAREILRLIGALCWLSGIRIDDLLAEERKRNKRSPEAPAPERRFYDIEFYMKDQSGSYDHVLKMFADYGVNIIASASRTLLSGRVAHSVVTVSCRTDLDLTKDLRPVLARSPLYDDVFRFEARPALK